MKIPQVFKDFKGRKGASLKEEGEGGGRGGAKGVALQTSPAGPPEKGGLNSALPETKPEPNQNSSSLQRGGDQSLILISG